MYNQDETQRGNYLRVLYLAFCFMMLFTAYNSAQSLLTEVYIQLGYERLGQYCFFSMYAGMIIASLISSHSCKRISAKTSFIGSAFAHGMFVLGGVLATYCSTYPSTPAVCSRDFIHVFNILAAFTRGLGTSFLWYSQSMYVNACATESVRGKYNGIFWSITQSSQVLGSILTTVVIKATNQFTFYLVLSTFSTISLIMFSFVKPPLSRHDRIRRITVSDQDTLVQSIARILRQIGDKRFGYLFVGAAYLGAALSFYYSFLGYSVSLVFESQAEDKEFINQRTGLLFLVAAFGGITGGYTSGKIADKFNKIRVLHGIMLTFEIALVLTFVAIKLQNYPLLVVSGALWGYGDASINAMLSVVVGTYFGAHPRVVSIYRFFQSCGSLSIAIISVLLLKTNSYLYIGIIAGVFVSLYLLFWAFIPSKVQVKGRESLDAPLFSQIDQEEISRGKIEDEVEEEGEISMHN